MKHKIKQAQEVIKNRSQSDLDKVKDAGEKAPRITNRTVAEHREEVIGRARRYIYPLRHSKNRIVMVSVTLFLVTLVSFFTYMTLSLYKFNSTSNLVYRVTQIVPFPIARVQGRFVSYENYLFELRRYTHYYENQQELDFSSDAGKKQLEEFKKRALDKIINDAYVKILANKNGVVVTDAELNDRINVVEEQRRLGDNNKVFEDVLSDFWGWSLDDFKGYLKQRMLADKVASVLDVETNTKAQAAYAELVSGADFGAVAKKYSDDESTKDNGGNFGFDIDRTNRDLTAITTRELFALPKGKHSEVLNIGFALQIVKVTDVEGLERRTGAHIIFNFKDISEYINQIKDENPARTYISLGNTIEEPEVDIETLEPSQ